MQYFLEKWVLGAVSEGINGLGTGFRGKSGVWGQFLR